jgi:HEAT repeat protein
LRQPHPDLLFSAARYLAAESGPAIRDRLRPLLLQNDSVARARAVASILVGVAPTCAEEQLRKTLLTDGDGNPPPVDDENNTLAWLAELDGPFREEARAAIERQGERAFGHLLRRWDRLSDDNREWLAAWGLKAFAGCATSVVGHALASNADRVACVALEFLAAHARDSGADASALDRFAKHANPDLRRAAIAAGATVDLRRCLAEDDDAEVRRVCVQRLADAEGVRALPDLVALLRGSDWAARAAATRALIGLGDHVVEHVKPLVDDPVHGARVAAVQVLVALGQECWLGSHLFQAPALASVMPAS